MQKKIATAYWNQGGFYLEDEPQVYHGSEASMHRRAHVLGYTHVCTKHGYYVPGVGFKVEDIVPHTRRIPIQYRGAVVANAH